MTWFLSVFQTWFLLLDANVPPRRMNIVESCLIHLPRTYLPGPSSVHAHDNPAAHPPQAQDHRAQSLARPNPPTQPRPRAHRLLPEWRAGRPITKPPNPGLGGSFGGGESTWARPNGDFGCAHYPWCCSSPAVVCWVLWASHAASLSPEE